MRRPEELVDRDFLTAMKDTKDNTVVSAILALAKVIARMDIESLSHEICLGVRYGLFGLNADPHTSIASIMDHQLAVRVEKDDEP